MLRACVISFGMKWEECLPYAEFSYNNNYQASLQATPFEVLYGRKCRTPWNWSETGERQLFGPDVIQEAEDRVKIVREHLKAAQSRKKAYYDKRHRGVAFQVGDYAYLRVSPLGEPTTLVSKHSSLQDLSDLSASLRLEDLELLESLSMVHDVFHVSQLKK